MNDETTVINPKEEVTNSVILLHGLGASSNDFIDIIPMMNLPNTRFILPQAPNIPITMNNGFKMPAWFDVFELKKEAKQDEKGIRKSEQFIKKLIEKEIESGISSEHIVIAGFSQGAAMSLQTGLRIDHKLSGILVLSGFLPLIDKIDEINDKNKTTPILMLHGTDDDIVPIEWAEIARIF